MSSYNARTFAALPPANDAPNRRLLSAFFPSRAASPSGAQIMKLGLFVFFIVTRAFHPLLIDASKTDGKILYARNTPVAMNKVLTVLLMNLMAYAVDGMKGVRSCWQPQCLAIFGMIGTIYALGDFLEMLSMSSLSGGVYQVLLQTKLLITALMIWWLKGSKQTPLQWHVLCAMFLAMSSFVLVDMDTSGKGGAGALPLGAVTCVLLKVAVSCYCAVLSEKYLKAYANMPLYAKISGLSTTWALASMALCMTEGKVATHGFFAHWDGMTWLVTLSFVVKTVSTMYLLQALDSVQKNIGEALAVIVIYISQVTLPSMGKSFELSVFLLAVLVVTLVKTYLLSTPKKTAAKDEKAVKPTAALAQRAKLVSLKATATPLMASLGIETLRCEVADTLPKGVFYGMLGDVHAVCGSTHTDKTKQCELMLLSQPPAAAGFGKSREAPYLPTRSLTVLGQLRDCLPREDMSPDQFVKDAEAARTKLVERCGVAA